MEAPRQRSANENRLLILLTQGTDLMDSPGDYPGYYPGWTPYDTGVAPNAAAIDIGLADCESSGDGATQVCTVSCQSHSR